MSVTMKAMTALGSSAPVGATTEPRREPSSVTGTLTTCAAMPMIALMRKVTPNATQKRPRVSRQDRTKASRKRARSRTRIEGTSSSFVVSHTASGMQARTMTITTRTTTPTISTLPPRPPAMKAAMITAAMMKMPNTAATEREANPASRQNAGAIRRQSMRSVAFTPIAAYPISAATTPCIIAVKAIEASPTASPAIRFTAMVPAITASKSGEEGETVSRRLKVVKRTTPMTTAVTTTTTSWITTAKPKSTLGLCRSAAKALPSSIPNDSG